ncbi:MAG: tetratricopeptide repeat protein [Chitinophagales bacterium]
MIIEATLEDVANQVRRQIENGCSTAVLIGSGCSASAGIPTSDGIVQDIENDPGLKRFIEKCDVKDLPNYMRKLSLHDRKLLMERYINRSKLNLAHIFLASLVRNGFVDCVLTTNFDNLALKALTTLNQFPAVYDLAATSGYLSGSLTFPAIIYLHGQHTGWRLMLTDPQMQSLKEAITKALTKILEKHTLIIVGYSGKDPVLDALASIPEFGHKAYWVNYKERLEEHVEKALFNDFSETVEVLFNYDADKFFVELHRNLEAKVPLLFTEPLEHLKETYELVSKALKLGDEEMDLMGGAKETIERARNFLEEEKSAQSFQRGNPTPEDLKAAALEALLSWKTHNPDDLFDAIKKNGDQTVKEQLAIAFAQRAFDNTGKISIQDVLRDYDKAIELAPNYSLAYFNRGIIYSNIKMPEIALQDYNRAIELGFTLPDVYNNRGSAHFELDDFENAMKDYLEAIRLKSDFASPYYNIANIYKTRKEDEVALEYYNKALEVNPDYFLAYIGRGKYYFDSQRFEKALQDFTTAIKLKPANAEYHTLRGSTYVELGKYDLALREFDYAIKIDPHFVLAFNNRSNLLRLQKRWDDALSDIKFALNLDPEYSYAYATLAEIYAMQGNSQEFYKNIQIALEKGCPVWNLLEDEAYTNYKNESEFKALLEKYKSKE